MKTTMITIAKCLGETEKAWKVIYTHFEKPGEFAIAWLPKSQTTPPKNLVAHVCWEIPMWLKRNITRDAKRYRGIPIRRNKMDDWAFGFGPWYNEQGFDVTAEVEAR